MNKTRDERIVLNSLEENEMGFFVFLGTILLVAGQNLVPLPISPSQGKFMMETFPDTTSWVGSGPGVYASQSSLYVRSICSSVNRLLFGEAVTEFTWASLGLSGSPRLFAVMDERFTLSSGILFRTTVSVVVGMGGSSSSLTQFDFQFAASSGLACKGVWVWQQPGTVINFPHPVLQLKYARWFVSSIPSQPMSIAHYSGTLVSLGSSYSIVFFPDDTSQNATVQQYDIHDPTAPIHSVSFAEHLQVVFDGSSASEYVPIVRRLFLGRKRTNSKKRDGEGFAETGSISFDVRVL